MSNSISNRLASGLGVLLLLSGCGESEDKLHWTVRREPMTEAECRAVSDQVVRIMASTPKTLSGHDQDWDDAIKAATASAKETLCRPTLWESRNYGRLTGKWRYLDETCN